MADSLRGGIVINEILADPNGGNNFDTDGSGNALAEDEFIELQNTSSMAIDISGLELWDKGAGNWFQFPAGTVLQSGGYAVVIAGVQPGGSLSSSANALMFDAGRSNSIINNTGDNVTLYDPDADTFVQGTFNGVSLDDPAQGQRGYGGFSQTATRAGSGEDFGSDQDGLSLQRSPDGSDAFLLGGPNPGAQNLCFAEGTLLDTGDGLAAVQDLRVGDQILTIDNGIRAVRWIGSKHWSAEEITQNTNLAPIEISAGALAPNLPNESLRVSRQHRILVRGKVCQRMFGTMEVLVPAKSLLTVPGVSCVTPVGGVTYYHIMFDQHELVRSNGIPTESFYLGRLAVEALPSDAREEIEKILGVSSAAISAGLCDVDPARMFVKGKRARRLSERIVANMHPVLTL